MNFSISKVHSRTRVALPGSRSARYPGMGLPRNSRWQAEKNSALAVAGPYPEGPVPGNARPQAAFLGFPDRQSLPSQFATPSPSFSRGWGAPETRPSCSSCFRARAGPTADSWSVPCSGGFTSDRDKSALDKPVSTDLQVAKGLKIADPPFPLPFTAGHGTIGVPKRGGRLSPRLRGSRRKPFPPP